jgi:NAD(P)-dependent dehydrogenase (short-subunit alcohol dehydrogenase family)
VPTVSFDFSNRVVVVTGAARGIGLALSRRFVDSGAHVVMTDVDEAELASQAKSLGGIPVIADVRRRMMWIG